MSHRSPTKSTLFTVKAGTLDAKDEGKASYTLEGLISDIKKHLGYSSGIGTQGVDEDYLVSIAKRYESNIKDWYRYFHKQAGKNYTRNTIENINHQANIVCNPITHFKQLRKCDVAFTIFHTNIVAATSSLGHEQRIPYS